MLAALKRVFKQGWQGFSRDGGLISATIFILATAILLISFLFLFRSAGRVLISAMQEKADISVYFKENSLEEDILNFRDELSQIPEVKDVNYVSREKALEYFNQKYEKDPLLMEAVREVGGNPFLASLNIKAFEASQYGAIVSFLESAGQADIVEKIDYHQRKPVIERIFSIASIANKTGFILSLILAIVAILISFNTIRLAIFHFREEIKIQRLVGAANWYIRGPFLAQGFIAGAVSALISLMIFTAVVWFLSPQIKFFFPDLNLLSLYSAQFWTFLSLQFASGISLGVVSSLIAVRKYLKV